MLRQLLSRLTGRARHAVPELTVVSTLREFWRDFPTDNKYRQYEYLYRNDPEVRGAIDKLSLLVAAAFHGYEPMNEQVREAIRRYRIPWLIHQIAKRLLIYGDAVYLRQNLQAVPMEALTIVETRDQIQDMSAQIFEANWYVLNELSDDRRKVFHRKRVLHFTLDPTPMAVTDLLGRYTFGVWSISPLESLKQLILWKHQMLYTDILWRMRNVPREHHRLDLSVFSPDNYSGSIEERIARARADAQRALQQYVEQLRRMKPDQGYVTSNDVEIDYVEPKSTNYRDPNELLNQLSDYLFSAIGIHPGAVKGKGGGSYASELIVKGYTGLVAQHLCRVIAEQIANQLLEPELGGDLEPIVYLELDIDRSERVRQVAILAKLGIMTVNELRQYIGLPPIEGGDVIPQLQSPGRPTGTPEAGRPEQTERQVRYPDTPESRRKRDTHVGVPS